MKRTLLWLPLLLFVGLLAVIASGLFRPADRAVHSAMVGQQLPGFALPPLVPGKAGLASSDFGQGKPRLLNVFASWCVPCITETRVLLRLKAAGVPIEGSLCATLARLCSAFFADNGDAYDRIGSDTASHVQFSLGSSGVPESFVIDGRGRIVLQHMSDLRDEDVPAILAAIKSAQ